MVNLKKQTLLLIAPHPDDEILGCGGLIKRIKQDGGKVYALFMTLGTTKDYAANGTSTFDQRSKEIEQVAQFLGYEDYRIAFPGDQHHLRLDSIPQLELISAIENTHKISLNKLRPTIIATPQPFDYNQDHRAVAEAVIAATRPAPDGYKSLQRTVLGYEFSATAHWSIASPQNPNFFVELKDDDLSVKIKALELYSSQVRSGSHTRSTDAMKNLAYLRGAQVGVKAAEAFYSYRILI